MIPSNKVSFVDASLEKDFNDLPENNPIKKE